MKTSRGGLHVLGGDHFRFRAVVILPEGCDNRWQPSPSAGPVAGGQGASAAATRRCPTALLVLEARGRRQARASLPERRPARRARGRVRHRPAVAGPCRPRAPRPPSGRSRPSLRALTPRRAGRGAECSLRGRPCNQAEKSLLGTERGELTAPNASEDSSSGLEDPPGYRGSCSSMAIEMESTQSPPYRKLSRLRPSTLKLAFSYARWARGLKA